jgi:dTDP-4-amino-4,6-dideoxygalactose transaminase
MPRERINIANPYIGEEEIEAVTKVLRSGMLACGQVTKKFEEEFEEYCGSEYAIAVTNGTVALQLAMMALDIGPGDEVIVPSFTFVATANSVASLGAKPVFVDIDLETYLISFEEVREKITPATKAIIAVHLYGLGVDVDALREFIGEKCPPIIGDAAQAHGASVNGNKVGSISDLETFSFYPTKNMCTGEGGMVTTNDKDLAEKMLSIRNHGRPGSTLGTYSYERLGLNFRPTDVLMAIGRVQLSRLESFNEQRRKNAEFLNRKLAGTGIITPLEPPGRIHAYHQYTIRIKDREGLRIFLDSKGIGSGIYYPESLTDLPHLQMHGRTCDSPNSELASREVLSLPIHPGLGLEEMERVSDGVIEWMSVND